MCKCKRGADNAAKKQRKPPLARQTARTMPLEEEEAAAAPVAAAAFASWLAGIFCVLVSTRRLNLRHRTQHTRAHSHAGPANILVSKQLGSLAASTRCMPQSSCVIHNKRENFQSQTLTCSFSEM